MADLGALYISVFSHQGRVLGSMVEIGEEGPDILLPSIVWK